jgi:low affinity Fe/Cu permease
MPEKERDMPSSVSPELGAFDKFAGVAARFVSRAPFFAAAVALVVMWLVEGGILMATKGPKAFLGQSYQLQINTVTTVVTFLLVALLQNTQTRSDIAVQDKLNAIADALGDFMDKTASDRQDELVDDVKELRQAVGLEEVVGAEDQPDDD